MSPTAATSRLGVRKMRPRDPAQVFRAASPLELFFDLIFVVAVSLSSAQLHHFESEADIGAGVGAYLMVFFAIWWAWMNFTWFASAFDTDDWPYRVLALTQMGGVVVLAVGTTPAMASGDFRIAIAGYIIMRLALVAQWLRASRSHPDLRRTALRYAVGIIIVQLLWVGFPFVPAQFSVPVFVVLMLAELAVPVIAELGVQTPWHPAHIADRYGSFTLIVLGESVLASVVALSGALEETEHVAQTVLIGSGGFVLAAGMWWLYFSVEVTDRLGELKTALPFGYGHYAVFAAAGAFSAGISVLFAVVNGESHVEAVAGAATLTVPIAIYVLGVWFLILRHRLPAAWSALIPIGAVLIAACALLPAMGAPVVAAVLAAAAVMVLLVIAVEASGVRDAAEASETGVPEASAPGS